MTESPRKDDRCRRAPAEVLLYLSGELEPAEAASFEMHLRDCPACRAALGEAERVEAAYRSVRAPDPDEVSIRRWMERLGPPRRNAWAERGWVAAAVALAAMLILAFAPWRSSTNVPDPSALAWDADTQAMWQIEKDLALLSGQWDASPSGPPSQGAPVEESPRGEVGTVGRDLELFKAIYPDRDEPSGGGG